MNNEPANYCEAILLLLSKENNIKEDDAEFISALISDIECLQNYLQMIDTTVVLMKGYTF